MCRSGFPGFNGTSCQPKGPNDTDIDCVPRGACAPPLLKFVRKKTNQALKIVDAYDLHADPDEEFDLLKASGGDPNYLGTPNVIDFNDPAPQCYSATRSMHDVLVCCIEEFYRRDTDKVWRPMDCNCPSELREWEVVYQDPGP